ncbi:hypothetical protein HY469_00620 [Candidatus Roizmanbacteria bacterium]|nr:hypothetical protein [Candidatus Roizmanbacteria bacterium]
MTLSRRLNYLAGYLLFMGAKYAFVFTAYYIAYSPLTLVVVICFALLSILIVNTMALVLPAIDLSTLEQIITLFNLENYSSTIDEEMIMKYFSRITLVITLVGFIVSKTFMLLTKKKIEISAKKQVVYTFAGICLLGFLAIASGFTVYSFKEASGLIPFIVLAEIVAVISYGLYVVFMSVAYTIDWFIQYPQEYLPFSLSQRSD